MTQSAEKEKKMTDLKQVLGELAGYASMCWEPKPTGVFDSTQAGTAVQLAFEKIDSSILSLKAENEKFRKMSEGT